MQGSPLASLSPRLNSYSNTKLTAIAARVVEQFNSNESIDEEFNSIESIDDELCFRTDENSHTNRIQQSDDKNSQSADDDDLDIDFAFVTKGSELPSPISPDEIFQNGQIRPVYPVFNRDLLHRRVRVHKDDEVPRIRLPLRRLFIEERESAITTSSSSSSEADELDGVPAEMYCVWRPNKAEEAEEEKSSSNSKRWRLKDLLPRSHSDGSKDSFVFLNIGSSGRKKENEVKVKDKIVSGENKKLPPVNRSGGEKRRTYLPYRQDLLGLFGNVNGLSKNL